MENEKIIDFPFSRFISPRSPLNEIACGEDYERFYKIRDEMKEFLNNLNQSGLSEETSGQIHYLYVALSHIENVEREIMSCCLSEELLSQSKITDDINCLKMMVLEYIRELSDCLMEQS